MAASITPLEQEILINPYSNKLFDFDTHSSKVYISRSVNNLLKSIGEDCVLDGLHSYAEYNPDTDVITINVDHGKAIVDSTLVEITSLKADNVLSIDVSPFTDTGSIILTLSYRFLNTLYSNLSKLKLFYVSSNGIDTIPDDFQIDFDRVILAKFTFNKTLKTVTQTPTRLMRPAIMQLRGKQFLVYPRSEILLNSFEEIVNLFAILNFD
jgi:hypothetical protein